jgi:hypothetical protein
VQRAGRWASFGARDAEALTPQALRVLASNALRHYAVEFLESAVLVRTLEPCKGESLDGLSNKPLELEHAVATAGGNLALSPCYCRPGYNPLKAETRVRIRASSEG